MRQELRESQRKQQAELERLRSIKEDKRRELIQKKQQAEEKRKREEERRLEEEKRRREEEEAQRYFTFTQIYLFFRLNYTHDNKLKNRISRPPLKCPFKLKWRTSSS